MIIDLAGIVILGKTVDSDAEVGTTVTVSKLYKESTKFVWTIATLFI